MNGLAVGEPIGGWSDDVAAALTPVAVTSGVHNGGASGWTTESQYACTALSGKIVFVTVRFLRSGTTISATSGNYPDTAVCTLNTDYRPPVNISAVCGNGYVACEAFITTGGTVTLRAGSNDFANGSTLTLTFAFVKP
jgi:hypothetical protein